jgi:hypothetical protein
MLERHTGDDSSGLSYSGQVFDATPFLAPALAVRLILMRRLSVAADQI